MININVYPRHKDFEDLLELYPLQSANRYLPDWYKEIKITKHIDDRGFEPVPAHAKRCPAIQSEILNGYVLPSWTDIHIEIKYGNVQVDAAIGGIKTLGPDDWEWIQVHFKGQIEQMNLNTPTHFGIFKLISPYYFVTDKGYGLSFRPMPYHFNQHIRILPGMVETDIWHETNFPFEFVQNLSPMKQTKFVIKAGEPLGILTPYKKNDKYNLVNNKYNKNIYEKQFKNTKHNMSISSDWKTYSRIHNKTLEEE